MQLQPRRDLDDTFVDIVLVDFDFDDDYYAAYELGQVEPDVASTTQFVRVRDTSRDHVVTAPMERVELEPVYSEPYAKVELAPSYIGALPMPLSSGPFEKIDLDVIPTPIVFEPTEMVAGPSRVTEVIATIVVLASALVTGTSIAWLALR